MRPLAAVKAQANRFFSRYSGISISASVIIVLLLGICPLIPELMRAFSLQITVFDINGYSLVIGGDPTGYFSLNPIPVYAAILFYLPLRVGYRYSCLITYRGYRISNSLMFRAGFYLYYRKIGCILLRDMLVLLWTMMLVVPGILKALSWFMVPYILTDCPSVPALRALKLSARMTAGHRGKIILMYLSFAGWMLLSLFTFGILEMVYLRPYMGASLAGLYEELKVNALRTGVIHPMELI